MSVDTDRVMRMLTFWLRPDFVLRVARRFQRIAGFDRSIALASSALTAMVPLLIFTSAILPAVGEDGAADDIIRRYDLSGQAAETVREAFSPNAEVSAGIGIFGALFLIVAVLSFTRALQRLFEGAWELPALSVRNSVNGLVWIGGLLVYSSITGAIRGLFDRGVIEIAAGFVLVPLAAAFFVWTGYMLSGKRIAWRDLIAYGALTASTLALYGIAASIYIPRLFESYATRYGVIGVVFALISALFAAMLVIVGSVAAGREVHDELGRIRRGERPSEDEVRRQWDALLADGRERWDGAREWAAEARRGVRRRVGGGAPQARRLPASPEPRPGVASDADAEPADGEPVSPS